jgi:translation elongation factor EF-1alpha
MNIQLRKFKPENMADDKVCVFIGKRGTGKSTLVTDILYQKKHLPVGIVMSATEEGNHHYKQFVPDCLFMVIMTEMQLKEYWKDKKNYR